MVTVNYLLMLGVATVLTLLLALASHAAHAYLEAYPDLCQDRQLPHRSPDGRFDGADYDDMGYWEFASLRNYALHAVGGILLVWGPGLWYWDRQEFALGEVCSFVGRIAITPLFCA
jgi:hypothetical protein